MPGEIFNQPRLVAFNNVTLTAAFTGNRYVQPIAGFQKLSVDIDYTRGGGEASSVFKMQIEHSPEETPTNWYSLVIDETGTESVLTPRVWSVTPASGNNAKLNVILDTAYKNIRISIRETGVVTNPGTATITIVPSGL